MDDLAVILEDDDYRRIKGLAEARVGDIVVYRDSPGGKAGHVGIVIELNPVVTDGTWGVCVLSKWGEEGEYIHPIDHVPSAYGQIVEYWTDRREI
jgi:hypothetical protein